MQIFAQYKPMCYICTIKIEQIYFKPPTIMATVSKTFASKASAVRALKRIFTVGPYSKQAPYVHAEAKFLSGTVSPEHAFMTVGNRKHSKEYVLELSSTYWSEGSMQRFLDGKESL